jgi:imidazolonepropionase-like amidohydrolase
MNRFPFRVLFGWVVLAGVAAAGPLVPVVPPATPVLLKGGAVHPVSGPVLPRADVLIEKGRIAAIGPDLKAPANAQVVEVSGRRVYPGLFLAATNLGMQEISGIAGTRDTAETGLINPNARAQVAVNPDNSHIGVTRFNGVLTALVVPLGAGSGPTQPIVAGQSALMRLEGWTWEEMTLRSSVGLHVFWPEMKIDRRPRATRPVEEQQRGIERRLKTLREAFVTADAYGRAKAAGGAATDLRWEAMLPFVRGEQPVLVHADELREIEAALDWAQTQPRLRIVLVGGLDSPRVAARLKAADIPVIVGGTHQLPLRRDDGYDAVFGVAAKLHAAGVRFCLAPLGETGQGQDRNLAYQAAKAAAHGLPADEALKAITLYPAQILGVAGELGSLEVGKRATLIVTDGDPLEIPTNVQLAFVDGASITLRSRHTDLRDKYQERIRRTNAQKNSPVTNP